MRRFTRHAALAVMLGGCATPRAILFDGMGHHHFSVTTDDPLAQTYFDQGLTLYYAFNRAEAVQSFKEVADLDPDCAMAWWGQALALGPYFNGPYDKEDHERAFVAVRHALALRDKASRMEQDLIEALACRVEDPPPRERAHLDKAYADAMERVWNRYPANDDVGVLYADARMNQHRWNLWSKDGQPNEHTLEAIRTLERALKINVNNPGANHLYIHATEASPNPERAEAAADRLLHLVPSDGHLVHMPSHIYIQVGRYMDAIKCNRDAAQNYRDYFAQGGQTNRYFSMAHDTHFMIWSAMFQGRREDALNACDVMLADLPDFFYGDWSVARYLAVRYHVLVRFGLWDEILASSPPRQDQPYVLAMWHYARGIALANTDRIEEARSEAVAFESEAGRLGPSDVLFFATPASKVLDVARSMLAGETAYKAGDYETGLQHLRAAVKAEDRLEYMEPSHWMMPTRHALGALLLERDRVPQAEECYRQDLKQHPGNIWSLHGLMECLERRGATAEAGKIRKQYEEVAAHATLNIKASCYCREGAAAAGESK